MAQKTKAFKSWATARDSVLINWPITSLVTQHGVWSQGNSSSRYWSQASTDPNRFWFIVNVKHKNVKFISYDTLVTSVSVAYFTKEVNQGLGKPLWITMEICVNFSNLLSKINHWRSMYQSALWSSLDDVIKWRHFVQYWRFVRGIHRSPWLPTTKANDAELWCFLWSVSEQTVELTIETLVIWDAIAPIMTSL